AGTSCPGAGRGSAAPHQLGRGALDGDGPSGPAAPHRASRLCGGLHPPLLGDGPSLRQPAVPAGRGDRLRDRAGGVPGFYVPVGPQPAGWLVAVVIGTRGGTVDGNPGPPA